MHGGAGSVASAENCRSRDTRIDIRGIDLEVVLRKAMSALKECRYAAQDAIAAPPLALTLRRRCDIEYQLRPDRVLRACLRRTARCPRRT